MKNIALSLSFSNVRVMACCAGLLLFGTVDSTRAQTPEPDLRLFIEKLDAQMLRLRWTGSGPRTLQEKQSLNDRAWTDVLTTSESEIQTVPNGNAGLYRVRQSSQAEAIQSKDATATTVQSNAAVVATLPFSNRQDFMDATNGLLAKPLSNVITNAKGVAVWDLDQYAFLNSEAPPTVNPSLWRQAQLNMSAGLFKVAERIYQVRGFDLANMTLVQGDKGWIVIDPLTCVETAAAAMDLVNKTLPPRPVTAVIFTHSHVDHFGGVKGVISGQDNTLIIAPEGFTEHAVSENVFAGNAMSRRSQFMYAPLLARNARAQIDAGLGKTTASGTVTFLEPNVLITNSNQNMTVDGLAIEFQLVPGSEAPSEMMFHFPQLNALCLAEDATHTLHNLVTLRGAQVRDALAWSKYLNDTIELFGAKTEVAFASHHWPTWGQEKIVDFLKKQRDLYKFLHDQSLRLLNQGYTPLEIAEMLQPPKSLSQEFFNRGYYGTVSHDVKAVYQRYIGWFDGNPAHLHDLPPVESSKKYVEFMGGEDVVLKKALASYAEGDYRWVAQVVNHVVFANPTNTVARQLQADALEQLGYQAESAPWRNFYLVGASELRNGVPTNAVSNAGNSDMLRNMPTDLLFDYFAIRLNSDRAEGKNFTINWNFTDKQELYVMTLGNSVLNYTKGRQQAGANVSLTMTRTGFNDLVLGQKSAAQLIASGDLQIQGDPTVLTTLFSLMDTFTFWFNIVTP